MPIDKATVWQQFSYEIGGVFIKDALHDRLQIKVNSSCWNIIFDVNSSAQSSRGISTRVRTLFLSKDNFLFSIYQQDIFSEIGKFFGMQDIVIGHPDFDKAFIIKSNNPMQIKALFTNEVIRKTLIKYPQIYFDIRKSESPSSKNFPDGVLELYLQVVGVVADIKELQEFHKLFIETLKQLCAMDSAIAQDSHLTLQS